MQKAIIIGATSGIGKALALLLINNGFKVGITGRRAQLLEKLSLTNENFYPLAFDASNSLTLEHKLNELVKQIGGLDLLIFSAGVGELNNKLNYELETSTIDINVKAFNQTMVWAYHFFNQQKCGHIAVITSVAGFRGSAIAPAYNASKAYQINYLEGLRQKITKQNLPITITDIRPGFVDTKMAKGDGKFWVASTEKAALQIFDAIKAKKSVIYVTKRWRIIAWLLKLMPRFLYKRM
jgi:short-subunit dehydrogenase